MATLLTTQMMTIRWILMGWSHAPATFTDADFKKLSDRDKYTNIDLSQSKVTGVGLAELKYCTATVRLILKSLPVKDSDMSEIVAMLNLKALDISDPMPDHGFRIHHTASHWC